MAANVAAIKVAHIGAPISRCETMFTSFVGVHRRKSSYCCCSAEHARELPALPSTIPYWTEVCGGAGIKCGVGCGVASGRPVLGTRRGLRHGTGWSSSYPQISCWLTTAPLSWHHCTVAYPYGKHLGPHAPSSASPCQSRCRGSGGILFPHVNTVVHVWDWTPKFNNLGLFGPFAPSQPRVRRFNRTGNDASESMKTLPTTVRIWKLWRKRDCQLLFMQL